jgi:thaumarchaeosortase
MQRVKQTIGSNNLTSFFTKILPIIAFAIPLITLYSMYPASFEETWKGRTYYIFFIWILLLETILGWETLQSRSRTLRSVRTAILILTLMLPTIYIVVANYTQLNAMIVDASPKYGGDPFWAKLMPLTVEYLVFTACLAMILLAIYGFKGLKDFSLSLCLVGIIGSIYLIDNLYPNGSFTPFQMFVPTTTLLASRVLNFMGYRTQLLGTMPILQATSPSGMTFAAIVGWPCSGVESLLIYTVIILLFLRRTQISLKQKTAYFVIGAAVTYVINIFRIATIFVIALTSPDPNAWVNFHNYYGQLYSITWIMSYPLIIIASRGLWMRIRCWRTNPEADSNLANPNHMPINHSAASQLVSICSTKPSSTRTVTSSIDKDAKSSATKEP